MRSSFVSFSTPCGVRTQSNATGTSTVWCYNSAGTLDKTINHGFLAMSGGRPSAFYGRAFIAGNGTLQTSTNSAGQSVTSTRLGVGTYEVVWNGLTPSTSTGNIGVLLSTIGGAEWESCGYSLITNNPVTIRVICVGLNGSPKDVGGQFNIAVVR